MTTLSLLALGLGSPAVALLVARKVASDDVASSMKRHREALSVLADLTADGPARTPS